MLYCEYPVKKEEAGWKKQAEEVTKADTKSKKISDKKKSFNNTEQSKKKWKKEIRVKEVFSVFLWPPTFL